MVLRREFDNWQSWCMLLLDWRVDAPIVKTGFRTSVLRLSLKGCAMTTEERLEKVERELAQVKRRNGRFVIAGVAALACVVVLLVASACAPEAHAQAKAQIAPVVWARKFVLVGENGKPCAILHVRKDGPGLALYDENGKGRASLSVSKDGPALYLCNENGKPRISLNLSKAGPALYLFDEKGEGRVMLSVDKHGPVLCMYDEKGRVAWEAP